MIYVICLSVGLVIFPAFELYVNLHFGLVEHKGSFLESRLLPFDYWVVGKGVRLAWDAEKVAVELAVAVQVLENGHGISAEGYRLESMLHACAVSGKFDALAGLSVFWERSGIPEKRDVHLPLIGFCYFSHHRYVSRLGIAAQGKSRKKYAPDDTHHNSVI